MPINRVSKAKVTAILLNWAREENLQKIISSLKSQTERPEIIVWDNAHSGTCPQGDFNIRSSDMNFMCWPRWLVASMAKTEYVMIMDDDVCPTSKDFIATCITESKKNPDKIIGVEGRLASREAPHYHGAGLPKERDIPVNMVIGKFMFLERRLLEKVPLVIPMWDWSMRGDDILISYYTGFNHILSHELLKRIIYLPEGNKSLWKQKEHFIQREALVKRLITPPKTEVEVKPNPNTPTYWDAKWKETPKKKKAAVSHQEIRHMMPENGKVLDVGSGRCELLDMLKERRPDLELVGVDFSRTAVAMGKKKGHNIIKAKVPPLPFKDKEFDVVIGAGILEHVDKDWELLSEMERVGKNVIFTVPEREPLDSPFMTSGEHRHIYSFGDFQGYVAKKLHDEFPRILCYSKGLEVERKIRRIHLGLSTYGAPTRDYYLSFLEMYQTVANSFIDNLEKIKGDRIDFVLPQITKSLPRNYFDYATCNLNKTKDELSKSLLASDCDYLMMIDADMKFTIDGIHALAEDDKDVVAGFYPRKSEKLEPTMGYFVPEKGIMLADDYPDDSLFCDYKGQRIVVPTGFTLIKRDVFLAMQYPRFEYVTVYGLRIGTDWTFCLRAWELGFKVWCDTRVKVGHVGEKIYRAEDYFKKGKKIKVK